MRPAASLLSCFMICGLGLSLGCTRLVNSFVYFPDRSLAGAPGAVGLAYEDLRFPAADGTELHGWWVPGQKAGPCVVFFHGNAGNISDRLDILRRIHDRLGLGVFLFDYRGYGKSSGRPSEPGLYSDARGARALVRAKAWDRQGEVLFGRSLGAAVALHSALEDPPSAVVLEAAFTSLTDLARTHYPILSRLVAPWIRGEYDNLTMIRELTSPVLFLHGDRDTVAPIGLGWRLFDASPDPKWFRTIMGAGHDDPAFVGGEAYWQAWSQLIEGIRTTPGQQAIGVEESSPNAEEGEEEPVPPQGAGPSALEGQESGP